ncbi:hypothetical protein PtA15_5A360 [Puccinia triticina]|uniref:Uncharacterized protein n=1 Tax=Puccinia triticina TaxID=208348 RepID=A0ABY7CJY4_9BASI|nr:uncharacterized protein PtA15_5A360 [Puccinia triticina]WAQ84787.1 hypothetical protein PtA15_5A360 [Puccinia triticina]
MISRVFLAYILIALGAIPASLVANPTAAADAEVPGTPAHPPTGNATLAPAGQTAAHPATPANSTASANISAAAGHPPANATTGPRSGNVTDTAQKDTKANETSAAPHASRPDAELPPTTICFPKSKSHGIKNHHCDNAFYQLPTNANGVFIKGKAKQPFARATSRNCTVTALTTNLSAFMMPRQFVLPTMKKLVNECGQHPSKIYFSGGTKGYNGDIWLSARASNKDLCH